MTIRAIKIDAYQRSIYWIEIRNLADVQQEVGGWIEVAVRIDEAHALFVDEEGLLKDVQSWFVFYGAHQGFAGNGVVLRAGAEHNFADSLLSLEWVQSRVRFIGAVELGIGTQREGAQHFLKRLYQQMEPSLSLGSTQASPPSP